MTRRDGTDDTGSPDDSGTVKDGGTTGSDCSDPTAGNDPSDRGPPPNDTAPDADSPRSSADPRRIGSLAVTESDVVDALEATARGGRDIVLRVTPPFSGRMRARLHAVGVVGDGSGGGSEQATGADDDGTHAAEATPVYVPPERFVADPPTYPTVDDTEDELRASATPYTRDRHRERHRAAVEEWRQTVRARLVGSIAVPTDDGSTTVSVSYLG